MAEKNIAMVLSENTGSTVVTSTATLTGTTVYGKVVTASTQVIQAIPNGSVSVTPDGTSITYQATSVTFTVSWTYLKPNSTIALTKGTGISSISPTSISVGSNVTSSVTITANVSENETGAARNLTLNASGTDGNNIERSDTGYYAQQASVPSLVVSVVSPSGNVPNSGGTVTFNIQWEHLDASYGISAYTGGNVTVESGPIPDSFSGASGNENITVELGYNTGSTATLYLYVSGHSQSSAVVSGSTSISQDGGFVPPTGLTYTLGNITYSPQVNQYRSTVQSMNVLEFYMYTDYKYIHARSLTMEDLPTGQTTCATTWTNGNTFEAASGSSITARITFSSTFAAITGCTIVAPVFGGGIQGVFNENMSSIYTGRYVYDFNIGTLPSSTSLGSFNIIIRTDSYFNIDIPLANPRVKVVNNTLSAVTISATLISSHYGFDATGHDTMENLYVSGSASPNGSTTLVATRRQSNQQIAPNKQEISVTWNFNGAPASTHVTVTVGKKEVNNEIKSIVLTYSGDVASLQPPPTGEYGEHLVIDDPEKFIITIG